MYADDGDFKKSKAKPIAALLALVAVAVAGVIFVTVGAEKDAEVLSPEKAALEKKRILVLPEQEQIAEFRRYAASNASPFLKEEALKRLAWSGDPAGVDLAIAALKDPEQKIRS